MKHWYWILAVAALGAAYVAGVALYNWGLRTGWTAAGGRG